MLLGALLAAGAPAGVAARAAGAPRRARGDRAASRSVDRCGVQRDQGGRAAARRRARSFPPSRCTTTHAPTRQPLTRAAPSVKVGPPARPHRHIGELIAAVERRAAVRLGPRARGARVQAARRGRGPGPRRAGRRGGAARGRRRRRADRHRRRHRGIRAARHHPDLQPSGRRRERVGARRPRSDSRAGAGDRASCSKVSRSAPTARSSGEAVTPTGAVLLRVLSDGAAARALARRCRRRVGRGRPEPEHLSQRAPADPGRAGRGGRRRGAALDRPGRSEPRVSRAAARGAGRGGRAGRAGLVHPDEEGAHRFPGRGGRAAGRRGPGRRKRSSDTARRPACAARPPSASPWRGGSCRWRPPTGRGCG